MKIIDVKTIRLRATIPAEGQVFSRSGVRNSRSATLVQIETDQGITGLGSCSGNGELIEVIVGKVLKPLLVGMDPTQIEEIWDKAYVRGGHKEFGTRGIGVVALSGIDIAFGTFSVKFAVCLFINCSAASAVTKCRSTQPLSTRKSRPK